MTLRLFDSRLRELRDFVPLVPGKVGIYICGLTTQAPPHLGHVRFAVAFDVLRRWLQTGHGYDVTLIRNVTDIDDKILATSAESGEPWFAVAYRNERRRRRRSRLSAWCRRPTSHGRRGTCQRWSRS